MLKCIHWQDRKKYTAGCCGFLIFKEKINVMTSISDIFATLMPLHQAVQCKSFYFSRIFSFQRPAYVFIQHSPFFFQNHSSEGKDSDYFNRPWMKLFGSLGLWIQAEVGVQNSFFHYTAIPPCQKWILNFSSAGKVTFFYISVVSLS